MSQTSIVIVEDEMIVALDLQFRLQDAGYDVPAIAISGEEALALAEQLHPSLMVMDIGLSGEMDGLQAAEVIHARHGIPIIFLTAYADSNTRARAEAISPGAFLAKPFDDNELFQLVNAMLKP